MNDWMPLICTVFGLLPLFVFSLWAMNEDYKDGQKHKDDMQYGDDLHA